MIEGKWWLDKYSNLAILAFQVFSWPPMLGEIPI
jgi:hypothetical protein